MKCRTCKEVLAFTGEYCDNCWEVQRRLEKFIKSRNGREFVYELLRAGPRVKEIILVPMSKITRRTTATKITKELQALVDDIKINGVREPILCEESARKYHIFDGELRFRAAQICGLTSLTVKVVG